MISRINVELYEVEVDIRGNHQVKALISKLQRKAFIREERYLWGLDEWNRRRREKVIFLVLVPRTQERAFKIMLTQTANNSPLTIKFRRLTSFL